MVVVVVVVGGVMCKAILKLKNSIRRGVSR
jgi:hypothetical protein